MSSLSLLVVFAASSGPAQENLPSALREMADAERAFARTATIKGVRDAFLEFFAGDALSFTPLPTPARDELRKQPSRPFSVVELVWEPRAGDVASSEELGWLTGPATFVNHEAGRKSYSCYLSVWRKQPDGRWRVFIDMGITSPEPVPFDPGFRRVSIEESYKGSEGKAEATRSLTEADRRLNHDVSVRGATEAYAARLTPGSRLHRNGVVPRVGPQAMAVWLREHGTDLSFATGAAEASAAGDLGYSYGTYERPGSPAESGPYVRVWARDRSGRWLLMADVAHPTPPRP